MVDFRFERVAGMKEYSYKNEECNNNEECNKNDVTLFEKGKKGVIRMIFSRFGVVLLLLVIQVLFLFGLFIKFRQLAPHYLWLATLFYVIMIVVLVNSDHDATSKITWLIVMVIFPIFGGLLYLYSSIDIGHRALKKRVTDIIGNSHEAIPQNKEVLGKTEEICPELTDLAYYLNRTGCFPIYENTQVTYFPIGEKMFEAMLTELEKAKEFIFMEYFILDEGYMWGKLLEVLSRKAKEGVDVRVMYDGTCEFALLPRIYPRKLEKLGIHCKVFAPITPFISTHYNYRDHRKIMVIDGKTAFNGGINLADEYINHIEKYGHWKDTGVMLKGEAVKSFKLMFLQMWYVDEKLCDFSHYLKIDNSNSDLPIQNKGFVIPYADCPLDGDNVGESVYMDILNRAHDYVYIMTPYLILDGELEKTLTFAAQRSVDVRLILPHIADNFVANALAKTHYKSLLKAGVKIYEYTPGFVHAKVFVSDDLRAVVGTINLDYRSLYHHFECATYLYDTPCIQDIKKDYRETLGKCQPVTFETIRKEKWYVKLVGNVMKFIAPLL